MNKKNPVPLARKKGQVPDVTFKMKGKAVNNEGVTKPNAKAPDVTFKMKGKAVNQKGIAI
ncbi:MAG: hypothetical protein LBC86_08795 [Oscillospiraceae bacterium]|nr:hypothetical protein [Oscillospiraceae bacterium]